MKSTSNTSSIWKKQPSIQSFTEFSQNTAISHMGIEFTEIGADFVCARMPVDERTRQPYGLLHGGASVLLAETLGSCAAGAAAGAAYQVVGLEINANHLRAAKNGWVTGKAQALHIGRSTQVWQIEIRDDAANLCCVSRITMAVLAKPQS